MPPSPIDQLPPAAAPDPNCHLCRGHGHIVTAEGRVAIATPCSCIPHCLRCNDTGRVEVAVDGGLRVGRCRCRMVHDRILLFNAAHSGRYASADLPVRHRRPAHPQEWQAGTGRYDRMPQMESFMRVMSGSRPSPVKDPWPRAPWRGRTREDPLLIATLRSLALEHGARVLHRVQQAARRPAKDSARGARARTSWQTSSMSPCWASTNLEGAPHGLGTVRDRRVDQPSRNAMKTTLGTTNYAPEAPTGALATNLARGLPPDPRRSDRQRAGMTGGDGRFRRGRRKVRAFKARSAEAGVAAGAQSPSSAVSSSSADTAMPRIRPAPARPRAGSRIGGIQP